MYVNESVSLHGAFFAGMLCTRVGRHQVPHSSVDMWVSCGWGVGGAEGRMFSLSYDIEHAAAS